MVSLFLHANLSAAANRAVLSPVFFRFGPGPLLNDLDVARARLYTESSRPGCVHAVEKSRPNARGCGLSGNRACG